MNKLEAASKVVSLRSLLRKYDKSYYEDNNPQVSDFEYDSLMRELISIETEFPELYNELSPSQRVSGKPQKSFNQIFHEIPMLSLGNTYNQKELEEFDMRVKKFLNLSSIDYICELKIDGVAVSLIYQKGRFISGSTRGDGNIGDDITSNLKTVKTIPLVLDQCVDLEVRGEIFMPKSVFQRLNQERQKKGLELFANPRNAAAGSLKQLDPNEVSKRSLSIFVYSSLAINQNNFGALDQDKSLDLLKRLGFNVNSHQKKCSSIEEILDYCNYWNSNRFNLPYDIDGIVIKVNQIDLQQKLGVTSKSPRWAISYKFPATQAKTKIVDITWQVGRTGVLTPVAHFNPTSVSGSIISKCSIYNYDEIQRKDIRIGDSVFIEKGGEVIPKITKVIKEDRDGSQQPYPAPDRCPSCNSEVEKLHDEAAYRCLNSFSCPAQIKNSLLHFCKALDIQEMGPKLVDRLVESGLVVKPIDLYKLTIYHLYCIDRMGQTSAQKILNEIEKSKFCSLSSFIFSLGIRHTGKVISERLVSRFKSIDGLLNASYLDIISIPGFGYTVELSIHKFFQLSDFRKDLNEFKRMGFKCLQEDYNDIDSNLNSKIKDKTFLITGTLSQPRNIFEKKIISNGGKLLSGVSKNLDYLIVGENPGSKYQKALNLGIPILNESDFLSLIGDQEIL